MSEIFLEVLELTLLSQITWL